MTENTATPPPWNVIVIGGALAGAATATLLLRQDPALRILIIEKNERFKRRVGESTVEVSTFFLGRVLGLTDHLQEKHFCKQGLRFWFHNERVASLEDASETGPGYNVRLPGYQIDRAVLDEEVLQRVVAHGACLMRSVRVTDVQLQAGGLQTVRWRAENGTEGVESARWIVDASGVAALISRSQGRIETNTEHPIASCWSRWRGVKHWDSRELAQKFPRWAARAKGTRFSGTNHLCGRGWWAWMIPLRGGDTSVGVVFDQRMVDLPPGESLGARLKALLTSHPVGREMLSDAEWTPCDVHWRRNLAYHATKVAGDGYVLVGDAAGFIDPFYSPGLDWVSYTVAAAAATIGACLRGDNAAVRASRHNALFAQSYDRWFRAIYKDKYFYMGDHELMTLAFRLDLGLYYLGVVSQPFKYGDKAFETPSFAGPRTTLPYRLIAFYNRRLAAIGLDRMRRGTWGRKNDRSWVAFRSYELNWLLPVRLLCCFARYLQLELSEGWHTWGRSPSLPESRSKARVTNAPVPVS